MYHVQMLVIAFVLTASVNATAQAQHTGAPSSPGVDPALASEAKISLDSARAIALHRVKHGRIRAEELERENGRLIYSFDVKVAGKSGIQEVNVNALNGSVVGVHHESSATEAREAREDSTAARKVSTQQTKPPV